MSLSLETKSTARQQDTTQYITLPAPEYSPFHNLAGIGLLPIIEREAEKRGLPTLGSDQRLARTGDGALIFDLRRGFKVESRMPDQTWERQVSSPDTFLMTEDAKGNFKIVPSIPSGPETVTVPLHRKMRHVHRIQAPATVFTALGTWRNG